MIRACFKKEKNDLRLVICGHAGYGQQGADVVCAAASGLFYAFAGYLVNFGKDDFSINSVEEGYADILCDQRYADVLKLIAIGLVQLEATYPGYVCVSESIWNWKAKISA